MTAPPLDACTATTALLNGRQIVTFGGCNYLGLAQHPRVTAAAAEAVGRFGLSASASRETTGNTRVHQDLEEALTEYCGFEAGLLVPDGYIANLAAAQGLAAAGFRFAVLDARAHASIRDAAGMAGMGVRTFDHLDATDARRALEACQGPAVIMTDSVFAADGAIAPAGGLLASLRPGDLLLLDDCHGFAVLGRQGRGVADHLGLDRTRLVITTTLAKGLGCGGGVVMGSSDLLRTTRARATAYVCTTPTSPVLAAAALESLRVLRSEPMLHQRLTANTVRVRAMLAAAGIRLNDETTPIVSFTIAEGATMRRIHQRMLDAGVLAPVVEYPGGPAPVYFRLSISAQHTDTQIDLLKATLHDALGAVCPTGATA